MSNERILRLGLVQLAYTGDLASMTERTVTAVREAATQGAKLVLLQELALLPYLCTEEDPTGFDTTEPIGGSTQQVMSALARELGIALVLPYFEKRTAGLYHNSLVVFSPDGEAVGHYRKLHIPDDPGYYEKYYFTPGDRGVLVANVAGVSLGTLICWDQWFPEGARLAALQGAEIIFYPTAIGWEIGQTETVHSKELTAWQTVQRGHAVANGCFVIAVNRVGEEGPTKFWGHSFVSGPMGEMLYEAGTEETIHVMDLDLSLIEETRRTWPFLRDRRIDAYEPLTRRFLD